MRELIEATLCYIRRENQTLFIYRDRDPKDIHYLKHVFPGGKLREGETPLRGVKREVKEETDGTPIDLVHRGNVLFDNNGRVMGGDYCQTDWKVYIYSASDLAGTLKQECESGKVLWVPDSDIQEVPMHEADKILLGLLHTQRRFNATVKYNGERVKSIEASFS